MQLTQGSWNLGGNSVSTNSFLGSTNNANLVFKRNNLQAGFIRLDNTSLGVLSLSNVTTGVYNTSFGSSSLQYLTSGNNNTSFGNGSLGSLTTGSNNIGIGRASGSNLTDGSNNIFVGRGAFQSIQSGNNNIIIGNDISLLSSMSDHVIIANGAGSLVINDEGKVIIGPLGSVNTPGNYKLYVPDGILTEKVKVALKNTSDWADYVFEEDYELMSLENVEKFIKENKHLPGISSAETLVEEGIDLGAMQAELLEKIEELTLYLIQKDKEVEELKRQVRSLIEQE